MEYINIVKIVVTPGLATTQYPKGNTDAHGRTRKKKMRIKVPLHSSNITTTTKTTPESPILQKRRLQEGNGAQTPSSPDLDFHPKDSPLSQNTQPIKTRPWIFTLKGKTLNITCVVAPLSYR